MDLRHVAAATFVASAVACAAALHHMESIPALILIAPGYLVQAWLFRAHLALGGPGYQATIIGVSALFWTSFLVGTAGAVRAVVRRVLRKRVA